MPNELNLQFPDRTHVLVTLNHGVPTAPLPFTNPLTEKDHADIRWYLETYGAYSLGNPDDAEAHRIAGRLPFWGQALFRAVFTDSAAFKRFVAFQQMEDDARLLTISADDPSVLVLPWELLHDPSKTGGFLFLENPRISIRRRVQGADDGRPSFEIAPKERVHLLFIVSRPEDAGFLDPRADSLPVLDAIDEHAPGRVTFEFLRPATLDGLLKRLENRSRPTVDILHFDGHGVFDRHGGLLERAAQREGNRFAFEEATLKEAHGSAASPPNTGYLLFETPEGKRDFVSAAKLGANLHRHRVSLVILSACQSAAYGEDAPEGDEAEETEREDSAMGSVAARLTATGIPSVLAMSHSVLVHTTRMLFGEFYRELAQAKAVGEALDNARRYLVNHPRKYDVQRGATRVPLELYDWFLPALYQPGSDRPLLQESSGQTFELPAPRTNLPRAPEAGFFGRRRNLWDIERWFTGRTRRITITGFGGQGKTALAQEAGRWLTRTGMFDAAAFVDYSRIQAEDAVGVAVSTIGEVLGENLLDAEAVAQALGKSRTLVILDNLETLAAPTLHALLDAAARWSEAGGSRVLCTTRRPTFDQAQYRIEGTLVHRRIMLDGLGTRRAPDDALEWCAALMTLPPAPIVPAPKREELIDLFDRVKFHPLSIRVLTQQLKSRVPAELHARLGELLAVPSSGGAAVVDDGTPASLVASLQLSVERLDAAARKLLPRLGVFQGGAFEDNLLAVVGLDQEETDRWPALRRQLEAAALIEMESIPGIGVPFLRFHPTLAPMLWMQLSEEERVRLQTQHQRTYDSFAEFLYRTDRRAPHEVRAIARRELPNLLHAVNSALDAGDPDAVSFVGKVQYFLDTFGFRRDARRLSDRAQASSGHEGSESWSLAQLNRGDRLLRSGNVAEAATIFRTILSRLGPQPSINRSIVIGQIGRCARAAGLADEAERHYYEALAVLDQLSADDAVKGQRSIILTDLGDALAVQGKYGEARTVYEEGLRLKQETNNLVGQGVTYFKLGTLALQERGDGWFEEAARRYFAALNLFEQLHEPTNEAAVHHQLGMIFEAAQRWEEAEQHYRVAARIADELGDANNAGATWNQLAAISTKLGKFDVAEKWFRKAIEAGRNSNDVLGLSRRLSNLATVLKALGRLAEAREVGLEGLEITKTLDADVGEIWKDYAVLAGIADKEAAATSDGSRAAALREEARQYRRLGREAQYQFAGTRHRLRKAAPLIGAVIGAALDGQTRGELEHALPAYEARGWRELVAAIRRILDGDRDADAVCEGLDFEDSMIVEAILRGLRDPSAIADLVPAPDAG